MAILYDTLTQYYVSLPKGEFELTLGRSSVNNIPVFIHKDRGEKSGGEILGNMNPRFASELARLCRTVSRQHASLMGKQNEVYIRDNQSTIGTRIKRDKKEITLLQNEETKLGDDDIIHLGEYRLIFYEDIDSETLARMIGEYKL